jgi:hypothetical protein
VTRQEFEKAVLAKPSLSLEEAQATMNTTTDPLLYAACNAIVSLTSANNSLMRLLDDEALGDHMKRRGSISAHDVEECVARKVAS